VILLGVKGHLAANKRAGGEPISPPAHQTRRTPCADSCLQRSCQPPAIFDHSPATFPLPALGRFAHPRASPKRVEAYDHTPLHVSRFRQGFRQRRSTLQGEWEKTEGAAPSNPLFLRTVKHRRTLSYAPRITFHFSRFTEVHTFFQPTRNSLWSYFVITCTRVFNSRSLERDWGQLGRPQFCHDVRSADAPIASVMLMG
jgi:hypothetical protein